MVIVCDILVCIAEWRWFPRKSLGESQLELLIGGRMPCGDWRKMKGVMYTVIGMLVAVCMTIKFFIQREA